MTPEKKEKREYTEEEVDRRRDAAVTRALNTPPKPHQSLRKQDKKAASQKTNQR